MKKGFVLFEFLCALFVGALMLYYMSSFWVYANSSFYAMTNSSFSFLSVMHSLSFIGNVLKKAHSDRHFWALSQDGLMIQWREGHVLKKLVFKDDRLIFRVRDGKKLTSKVLIKKVFGTFELFGDGFFVHGMRMRFNAYGRDMTVFFPCLRA